MERSFGHDFSAVRIHQDSNAAALGARAFAQSTNIHFAPGQYDPSSQTGLELLAHELAHVVQQSLGRAPATQAKADGVVADDSLEAEADDMAARAARGEPASDDQSRVAALTGLPVGTAPRLPKLGINRTWVDDATTIANMVVENGGDQRIVAILQRWAGDDDHQRMFWGWADAIEEARRAARRERLIQLVAILIIVMVVLSPFIGIAAAAFLGNYNRYEARPGMGDTAVTARRPLEPVMRLTQEPQLAVIARHAVAEQLRQQAVSLPVSEILDGHPQIERIVPDAARLRHLGEQLDGIADHIERAEPLIEEARRFAARPPADVDNPARTGPHHEHIFFGPIPRTSESTSPPRPDSSTDASICPDPPSDLGYFDDGVRPDRPDLMHAYTPPQHHYDRALMQRAALEVANGFGDYHGVTHNCQDFVEAVRQHYTELGGREVVPTTTSAVTLAILDTVTPWIGRLLDWQIDNAIREELASSLPQGEGTECAVAITAKLGIDAKIFGPAVDAVLDHRIPRQDPGAPTMRELLCAQRPRTRDALLEIALDQGDAALDRRVEIPEEGETSLRAALCTPKSPGGITSLEGVVFELALLQGGPKIDEQLHSLTGYVDLDVLARNKLKTDLVRRLADNLLRRLNLKGICG